MIKTQFINKFKTLKLKRLKVYNLKSAYFLNYLKEYRIDWYAKAKFIRQSKYSDKIMRYWWNSIQFQDVNKTSNKFKYNRIVAYNKQIALMQKTLFCTI